MSRPTRTYAAANLEGYQMLTRAKRHHPAAESEQTNLDSEMAAPQAQEAVEVDHMATTTASQPVKGNRTAKVVPRRSPLPDRAKRSAHPGAPDMAKPRRTSAEVAAAAEKKVDHQRRVKALQQKKVEAIAEFELQEDEDNAEEAEEYSAVRMTTYAEYVADCLEGTEDVTMQFYDDLQEDPSLSNLGADGEIGSEEEEMYGTRVAPTQTLSKKRYVLIRPWHLSTC